MSMLEDTAIFAAIIAEGGFAKAAQKLNLSNGLVSRRLAALEKALGVSLIKRTTRQFTLTPEGEMFWQHAKRIQQEMESALGAIHSLSARPSGHLRISAPPHFGRHCLSRILNDFMKMYTDITVELILSSKRYDPIKENLDLQIRGMGYIDHSLPDSNMKSRLLLKSKNRLYATREYLLKYGIPLTPEDLQQHRILGQLMMEHPVTEESWTYWHKGKKMEIVLKPTFYTNDMEFRLAACFDSLGITKFSDLVTVNHLLKGEPLVSVLPDYDWGEMAIYAIYSQQQALPARTRLLLDFLTAQTKAHAKPNILSIGK